MKLDNTELLEFDSEAQELLQEAEDHLLKMENEKNFITHYATVFRSFHSLKGASAMLGFEELREHLHRLESLFVKFKDSSSLAPEVVTFFLKGIDVSRSFLKKEFVEFSYDLLETDEITKSIALNDARRIFIIDDEEENLEIISSMIKSENTKIECFTSALEALKRCEESMPDLVLTDMKMPTLSGIDVLKRVKLMDSEIPVIFISSYLDKETLVMALNLGVFAVLDKPIKETVITNYITQAMNRRDLWKLLNRSIDLILFQINDMEDFLRNQGKSDVLETMKEEVRNLLLSRRSLQTSIHSS